MSKTSQSYCDPNCGAYRVMNIKAELILGHFSQKHHISALLSWTFQDEIFNRG